MPKNTKNSISQKWTQQLNQGFYQFHQPQPNLWGRTQNISSLPSPGWLPPCRARSCGKAEKRCFVLSPIGLVGIGQIDKIPDLTAKSTSGKYQVFFGIHEICSKEHTDTLISTAANCLHALIETKFSNKPFMKSPSIDRLLINENDHTWIKCGQNLLNQPISVHVCTALLPFI